MADDVSTWEVDPNDLELLDLIGTGCTAEVYRGMLNGREVAVKQMDWDKTVLGMKEALAFDREVAIMPRICHEHLVKFIGMTSLQRPCRIVTEFCSGGCCFELLHNCEDIELEWSQQGKMCLDVALAMDYLHQFNPMVIHRDLKSLNLLLARPVLSGGDIPVVKVSDFGLSRMRSQAAADGGKMTALAGTHHWMAPEVFIGGEYNEKVDVYSYAMVLFEIICREIPFEDHEAVSVGKLIAAGERPDMESVPPDCPRTLRDLMVACWVQDPKQRPPFDRIVPILRHEVKDPRGRPLVP
mmetsp:Transcript_14684/g.37674  ORF Transcript_14684/g.37674 Transcript_14684/m.37674 type:complete len:297 (+) Transcript_14684:80-970(+)